MDEPRGCPTPGACSAVAQIAALLAKIAELEQTLTLQQTSYERWRMIDKDEIERLQAELDSLRAANEAFGKRQDWWTQRMFELEQQRDALRHFLDAWMKEKP